MFPRVGGTMRNVFAVIHVAAIIAAIFALATFLLTPNRWWLASQIGYGKWSRAQ
jgi:hypothetical protein